VQARKRQEEFNLANLSMRPLSSGGHESAFGCRDWITDEDGEGKRCRLRSDYFSVLARVGHE
jgi:hypothetical protein